MTSEKVNIKRTVFHSLCFLVLISVYWYVRHLIVTLYPDRAIVSKVAIAWTWIILMKSAFLGYVIFVVRKWKDSKDRLGFEFKSSDIEPGIIAGIVALVVEYLLSFIVPIKVNRQLSFLFNINYIAMVSISILYITLYSSIIEEIAIRGFLWSIMERDGINIIIILILTSLLYSVFHLSLYKFPGLFVQGMLFGILRIKTKRIGSSVIAHITINLVVSVISITV